MPVPTARKESMIQMEYASGFMKYVTMDKVYLQEQCTYNGYTYTVYKGSGDGGAAEKIVALKAAVKTVIDAGFTLPAGLRWYCINDMNVQNRVFARDPGWNAIYYVTLGPTTCTPGSVASISNGPHPGFTKGHVTCIHELGHVLHAARLGEDFYATNDQGGCTGAPTGVNAVKVSGYAGGAKKEFVAEVFAGMMIGRTYDDQVMAEYRLYKGPER